MEKVDADRLIAELQRHNKLLRENNGHLNSQIQVLKEFMHIMRLAFNILKPSEDQKAWLKKVKDEENLKH